MIGSIGLMATDIYLAALPEMAIYFNCSQTEIQSSFTVFLLGLAGCQLVTGVLTDRFGQKRVALVGFSVFICASLLCVYATTLTEFISCRFLQAIGGGVGSVMSRAVVVNRFKRHEAVKIFSTTLPVIGLSSAIAPLIGGYLTSYFGWRSTFLFMAGFGVVLLFMGGLFLSDKKPELTLVKEKIQFKIKMQRYFGMFRNLEFVGYALIVCTGFCVFRSYTVESPFVFSRQGYDAEEIGHFYIALSLAYLSGNLVAKKLVNRMSLERVLRIGLTFSVLGAGCFIVAVLMFADNPYAVIIPMSIITFGNGFLFPISTAGAMTAVPSDVSGTASGLMGAVQFVTAALCINWVGKLCQGNGMVLSFFIGTVILCGLCSYLFLIATRPKARIIVS